jgi:hypothetical protein
MWAQIRYKPKAVVESVWGFESPPPSGTSKSLGGGSVSAKEDDESYGYTFDTDRNEMLASHKRERMRYDRIMHRLAPSAHDTCESSAQEIDLIGTSPVGGQGKQEGKSASALSAAASIDYTTPPRRNKAAKEVFPSDHFGLLGKFVL